jgi:hypothetical protein
MEGNEKRSKLIYNISCVVGVVVVVLILISGLGSGSGSGSAIQLTQSQANLICKKYIGKQFGRNSNIISTSLVKKDGNDYFIKASYTKDGERWDNICYIFGDKILWAGVFANNEIGRWRYEDEAVIVKTDRGFYELK